jgi:hypothetical protein
MAALVTRQKWEPEGVRKMVNTDSVEQKQAPKETYTAQKAATLGWRLAGKMTVAQRMPLPALQSEG